MLKSTRSNEVSWGFVLSLTFVSNYTISGSGYILILKEMILGKVE